MKISEYNSEIDDANARFWTGPQMPASKPGLLHLITAHELEDLHRGLDRAELPLDFETKLTRLAGDNILHCSVEQNCRLFIALLRATRDGSFRDVGRADQERLLRVLAYVRRDDDAIPDYKSGGFVDDQREVRAANLELAPLLQSFKAWRLRHQVPGMWAL